MSEIVISQSPGVEWRRKWLPVAWLATWGLAVMSAAVPYWWVIGLLAIGLWELTWQMSGTDKAPVLSLERVNSRAIQSATFAAITLFALFWVCVKKLASAGLWRGTCGKSAVVGTHLSNNRRAVLSRPDV